MREIEPTTLTGLQAKAEMLFEWFWHGSESDEDPMAVEIIRGLASVKLDA